MKKSLVLCTTFLLCMIFMSCTETLLEPKFDSNTIQESKHSSFTGSARLVFSSREELSQTMEMLNEAEDMKSASKLVRRLHPGSNPHNPGLPNYDIRDTNRFTSLYEHNKEDYFASLTPEERTIIESDPEELEFALPDSIIKDFQFSCILNKDREIQIGDTVFRFVAKGIGYTSASNAQNLIYLDSLVRNHKPSITGGPTSLDKNIQFIWVSLHDSSDIDLGEGASSPGNTEFVDSYPPAATDLTIPGTDLIIPKKDVRETEFNGRWQTGDEGSVSGFFKGFFGAYNSAFKYFSKDRKLNLNFYDQNYIIYSNIGTKLKFQKKVLGIWWNVKAEEMYHGWETMWIDYELPNIVTSYFPTNIMTQKPSIPTYITAPITQAQVNRVLLHLPFGNYDIKEKDLAKAFKLALQKAKAIYEASKDPSTLPISGQEPGIYTYQKKTLGIIYGPNCMHVFDKKSTSSKFFSKWFPCAFSVSAEVSNGTFKIVKINIDPNDHVELRQGSCYGAIKYNGKWLGARIKKYKE